MKVLHVLNELRPSGAEILLRSAAPLWSRHGVSCDIVTTGTVPGPYAPVLADAGYGVHHLPNTRNLHFLRRFVDFVKVGQYDIVHQHAEGMSFWLGLASRWAGARVVRTLHSNFAFEGGLRFKRGLQRRLLAALGARFVAIGDSVKQNEWRRFGLECTLVRNWADLARLKPPTAEQRRSARARWGLSDDDFVVVSVGNCAAVKNHDALLHALALSADLGQVRYLHVGLEHADQPERTLARELGVEHRVTFTGWLDDPRHALYAANVYVMPSFYEGFGVAAVEALAIGLPAILTEVPGLVDLRAHFPGLVYAEPNAQGLAAALAAGLSMTKAQRERLSKEYRRTASKHYSADRGVNEYGAVYASVLGRKARQESVST